MGFFTENTGSLRNPETRRTPSYGKGYKVCHKVIRSFESMPMIMNGPMIGWKDELEVGRKD